MSRSDLGGDRMSCEEDGTWRGAGIQSTAKGYKVEGRLH